MSDGDYDEGEHVKEAFAYFGLAAYSASVVETGLAHALLHIEFLTEVQTQFLKNGKAGFNRAKYEADFDAFLEKQFSKTMGTLTKRIETVAGFDDALKRRITEAVARRNFLTHHYWREMAEPFATRIGRSKMISELQADSDCFEKLDEDIQAALKPTRQKLGIKDEWLEAHVQAHLAKTKSIDQ